MKYFLLSIVFSFSLSVFSQDFLCHYVKHDTTIHFSVYDDYLEDHLATFDKNKVWFYAYNASLTRSNSFKLYCFDIETCSLDSFIVKIPQLNKILRNNNLDNFSFFSVYKNTFLLGAENFIFVLQKRENKFVISEKIFIPQKGSFNYGILMSEDCVFLGRVSNNSFRNNNPINSHLLLYNFKNKTALIIYPDFKFIASMHCHFGGSVFSVCQNQIAFRQRADYAIDFYNINLRKTDSICLSPKYWIPIPENEIEKINPNQQPQLLISQSMPLLKKYSFLDRIYFIDSNTLLIGYFCENLTEYYDVLKKRDGKWEITISQLKIDLPNHDMEINKGQYFPLRLNMFYHTFFTGKKMITFSSLPDIDPNGMTVGEYLEKTKKHAQQFSNKVSVSIFTLDF